MTGDQPEYAAIKLVLYLAGASGSGETKVRRGSVTAMSSVIDASSRSRGLDPGARNVLLHDARSAGNYLASTSIPLEPQSKWNNEKGSATELADRSRSQADPPDRGEVPVCPMPHAYAYALCFSILPVSQ
jgi:hypothetical protein